MPRLLVLSEYSEQIASARARIYAYLPSLRADGFSARILTVTRRFAAREPRHLRLKRLACVAATAVMAPFFDVVLVHRLFPRPFWLGRWLRLAASRLVLDFDESYHVTHLGEDVPASSLARLQAMIGAADCTVVSNEYLAAFARPISRATAVIPTPVDVGKYPRRHHVARSPVVIGWIGSGGAQEYLGQLTAVFTRLHERFGDAVRLEVVTAPAYRVRLQTPLHVAHRDWTEAEHYRFFASFDIGIMPLTDNRRSRGKASFKALEYMAAALPAVVSPVGMNVDVVEDGVTGFVAASDEQWYDVLSRLIGDARVRQEVGDRGRRYVEEHFDVTRWYPEFRRVLDGRS